MPSVKEVSDAKVRVATLIGFAVGILLVAIYLLLGGADWLAPAVTVRTYMTDLSGLMKGSPVRFNGIQVGKVKSVALSGLKDPQKVVRVEMSLMQRYIPTIPGDSTVAVTADNLLGDNYAKISEGKSPRHLQPGGELQTPQQPGINMGDLMKAAREIVGRLDALFSDIEAGRGELGKFVQGEEFYNDTLAKVTKMEREMRAATSKDTMAGRLLYDDALYGQLRAPLKLLDQKLAAIEGGQGAAGKIMKDSAQYDQLRKSVGDLNRTLEDLRAGKGQVGKFLMDDEQYSQIARMIDNLNQQVDAFNASQLVSSTNLYDSLMGSTRQLEGLLKDFGRNPKKFLWLKLF